jgi:hypothetical protein
MKRSEVNALVRSARACFERNGWTLPPEPRWDVTDFGLGDVSRYGLVLVNLAEEPEYCEKLMYARRGMTTPSHWHAKKKEDIICRWGELHVTLWHKEGAGPVVLKLNGKDCEVGSGTALDLGPGSRVTLFQGVVHEFVATSEECIIGEVGTANDDLADNLFTDPAVGRFPGVEEDEPPLVRLVSDPIQV